MAVFSSPSSALRVSYAATAAAESGAERGTRPVELPIVDAVSAQQSKLLARACSLRCMQCRVNWVSQ